MISELHTYQQCVMCNKYKAKKWMGQYVFTSGKQRKVYVDGIRGLRWRGNHCPDCSLQEHKKEKTPVKVRFCRECKKTLGSESYFYCATCRHNLHINLKYTADEFSGRLLR